MPMLMAIIGRGPILSQLTYLTRRRGGCQLPPLITRLRLSAATLGQPKPRSTKMDGRPSRSDVSSSINLVPIETLSAC